MIESDFALRLKSGREVYVSSGEYWYAGGGISDFRSAIRMFKSGEDFFITIKYGQELGAKEFIANNSIESIVRL